MSNKAIFGAVFIFVVVAFFCSSCASSNWYLGYGIASETDLRDPASGPAIVTAFADKDPQIRLEAIKAYRELNSDAPGGRDGLRRLSTDKNPSVAVAAIEALVAIGEPRPSVAAALVAVILSDNPYARRLGILAHQRLGYIDDDTLQALQAVAAGDVHGKLRPLASSAYREVALAKIRAAKGEVTATGPRLLQDSGCQPRDHDLAVVIGIESYREVSQRSRYSVADARDLRQALREMCIPDRNIQYLIGEEATLSAFRRVFDAWLPNRVSPDSSVIVYYSGHGAPDPDGRGYLLPVDADPSYLAQTAYPIQDLYDSLASLPVKDRIVLLDSCFSGAGGRSVLPADARPVFIKAKTSLLPPAGIAVMTASGAEQISSVYAEKGHGIFSYYLLEALGQGNYSLAEIYDYLRPVVEDAARKNNVEQSPEFLASGPDKARFRLLSQSERPK